jgi:hypothetical protein
MVNRIRLFPTLGIDAMAKPDIPVSPASAKNRWVDGFPAIQLSDRRGEGGAYHVVGVP